MVDVWLLFFFAFNASITAFHILIDEKFRDEKEKALRKAIVSRCRFQQ